MKINNWFKNLKIRVKILISLAFLLMIIVIIANSGVYSVYSIESEYKTMYQRYGEGIGYLGNLGIAFNESRACAIVLLDGGDDSDDPESLKVYIEDFNNETKANLSMYKDLLVIEEDKKNMDNFEKEMLSYMADQDQAVELYQAGDKDGAYTLLHGQAYDTHKGVNDSLKEIMDNNVSTASEKMEGLTQQKNRFLKLIFALFIVAIIFTIAALRLLVSAIADRINKLVDITEKVAVGDVNITIDENLLGNDEIGILAKAEAKMVESIKNQSLVVQKMAEGDFSSTCEVRSDEDVLSQDINMVVGQLVRINTEIIMIAEAAEEGKLDVRSDSSEFKGAYKGIVEGLNAALDAFKEPITYVSESLVNMAAGGESLPLTKEYKGDYNILINSLQGIHRSLYILYEEIMKLNEASEKGDLSFRGDSSGVTGGYKDMLEGINDILDKTVEPITEASEVLGKLAEGDLTPQVTGDYKGDYAIIKESLNTAIDSFNSLLLDINSASEQVAAGAGQISDSSILLSEGTTEQASSIEELTASTEQISSQTMVNADNAENANKISKTSKENALEGNRKMENLLVAMDDINSASNDISAVIKVIEDIAFQTNILALNAAVEAARAGQYGKGFAVVAEEVKNLAERSANAARETTQMIEDSIEKSEIGKKFADETARELEKIVNDIEEVGNLVDDIFRSSKEQAIGIEQINQGIMQVSEVVQTNSATSEESAAASEELSSQAEILRDNVQQFRLRSGSESSYSHESLSPKVDEMLNDMSKKNQLESKAKNKKNSNVTINLDDNDFGKYQ